MNVALSAVRTSDKRLNRPELAEAIRALGHRVFYLGQASGHPLHPDFEKYKVTFLPLPIERIGASPPAEAKVALSALKTLKAGRIDALIAYGIRTFPALIPAARLAGVRRILCVVNGSGRLFLLKGWKGLFVKAFAYPLLGLAFFLATAVLFQNRDDLAMIRRKGLLWRRNYDTVDGSGVSLEDFVPSGLPEKPVFSMISRLTRHKGVNEYIQAARAVKARYPESEFHLVGPLDDDDAGIDLESMHKAAAEGALTLGGEVEDVRPAIARCRCFVLPSYYPEGIPRSILEAMAMGRPIITADSPGCRETVIDGRNGFLVPPGDAGALAGRMAWMIEHPEIAAKMGRQSRSLCEERFDVRKINALMLRKIGLS